MTKDEVKTFCERYMPSYELSKMNPTEKTDRDLSFCLNPLRIPYVKE
jgi:hypothetical protein